MSSKELEFVLKMRDEATKVWNEFKNNTEKGSTTVAGSMAHLQEKVAQVRKELAGAKIGSDEWMKSIAKVAVAEKDLAEQSDKVRIAINSFDAPMKGMNRNLGAGNMSMMSLTQIMQDAPYGIRGVANNIQFFTQSFAELTTQTGSVKSALSAMLGTLTGPMGILFAVSAATVVLDLFAGSSKNAEEEVSNLADAQQRLNELLLKTGQIKAEDMLNQYRNEAEAAQRELDKLQEKTKKTIRTFSDPEGRVAATSTIIETTFGTPAQIEEARIKLVEAQLKIKDLNEKMQRDNAKALEESKANLDEQMIEWLDSVKKANEIASAAMWKEALEPFTWKTPTATFIDDLNARSQRFSQFMRDMNRLIVTGSDIKIDLFPESTLNEIQTKIAIVQTRLSDLKMGTPDFSAMYAELERLKEKVNDALKPNSFADDFNKNVMPYLNQVQKGFNLIAQAADQAAIREINAINKARNAALKANDKKKDETIARIDAELEREDISEERRKQLRAQRNEIENKYASQENAIREEYDRKEADAKRKAFQADKAAKIVQSIIDTASAVVEALPNIPLSIAVGVLGAVQTGLIASQPEPEFHEGGIMDYAGRRQPLSSDERPAILRVGETVRTPEQEAALSGGGATFIFNFNSPVPHADWVVESVKSKLRQTGLTVDRLLVNQKSKVTLS